MKANNGIGNNEERDEWETPIGLINSLNKQYNFDLDCCATIQNKKAPFWTSDFLNKNCNGHKMAWMNPPFSKAEEMFEHFFKVIQRGIAIYRCDNFETRILSSMSFGNVGYVAADLKTGYPLLFI